MHISETIDRTRGVEIGKYTVFPCLLEYPDGTKSVFIEHESGEGAQFPSLSLEKVVSEFYDKYF